MRPDPFDVDDAGHVHERDYAPLLLLCRIRVDDAVEVELSADDHDVVPAVNPEAAANTGSHRCSRHLEDVVGMRLQVENAGGALNVDRDRVHELRRRPSETGTPTGRRGDAPMVEWPDCGGANPGDQRRRRRRTEHHPSPRVHCAASHHRLGPSEAARLHEHTAENRALHTL